MSLESLYQADQDGCPVCHFLALRIRMERDTWYWAKVLEASHTRNLNVVVQATVNVATGWYDRKAKTVVDGGEGSLVITFQLSAQGYTEYGDLENMETVQVAEITFTLHHKDLEQGAYQAEDYTGSSCTLDLALQWLQICRRSHKTCARRLQSSWRPTRLIDLASIDVADVGPVLRESSRDEYLEGVEYVTLSHRWCGDNQLQLTKDNIEQLRVAVPHQKCKASIKDAIRVAQHLGLQYIWVDSLCIIQDDSTDKAIEISRMHDVYSNSQCNIAASDAEKFDEGCFFYRNASLTKSEVVETIDQAQVRQQHHVSLAWTDSVGDPMSKTVLGRRGWVFQEYLLSPRILFFGKHQLSWGCEELEASEAFPIGRPDNEVPSSANALSLKRLLHMPASKQPIRTNRSAQTPAWNLVVESYTLRDLTFFEDRLAALDGAAAYFQRIHGGHYMQGLWRETLFPNLLWENSTTGRKSLLTFQDMAGAAPSWSWASVDGMIYFDDVADRYDVRWLVSLSSDKNGTFKVSNNGAAAVSSSEKNELHLCGKPFAVELSDHSSADRLIEKPSYTWRESLQAVMWNKSQMRKTKMFKAVGHFNSPRSNTSGALFCLPLLTVVNSDTYTGLILQQIDHRACQSFHRIGMFESCARSALPQVPEQDVVIE